MNLLRAGDGLERLRKQRRNTTVHTWSDRDGMTNIRATFDPERGERLVERVRRHRHRLFPGPDHHPADCPDNPDAVWDHLDACALADLVERAAHTAPTNTPAPASTGLDPSPELDASDHLLPSPGMLGGPPSTTEIAVLIDLDTLTSGLHDRSLIDTAGDRPRPRPDDATTHDHQIRRHRHHE